MPLALALPPSSSSHAMIDDHEHAHVLALDPQMLRLGPGFENHDQAPLAFKRTSSRAFIMSTAC